MLGYCSSHYIFICSPVLRAPRAYAVSGDYADVYKMADEESLGIVQFVIILLVTLVFGGVLIAIVLFVGRKKQEKEGSNDSRPETKVEDLKSGQENANDATVSKKTSSKSSKRAHTSNEHPKQLCILKGHTSDVLYIEFTSNGKLLGSTSSGIIAQDDIGRFYKFVFLCLVTTSLTLQKFHFCLCRTSAVH